jgi:8-oxo-dGTP diphosphatase
MMIRTEGGMERRQDADPARDAHARPLDVAVAVLTRPDGAVLLARRPGDKVYAGYWEFPGGKLEPGEQASAALKREIREELGVVVERAYPWITRVFKYPHATVRLHFYRVTAWQGVVVAREHEALVWEQPQAATQFPSVAPVLPANGPVLRALALPVEYAISQCGALGEPQWLERLRRRVQQGLKLVQVREPHYPGERLEHLVVRVLEIARPAGARILINRDIALAQRLCADGVHLSARQLAELKARPELPLVAASCHDASELRLAERLGADFAVLGPVNSTPSHANQPVLGWHGFEANARGAALPVYALGGVDRGDLETAWTRGAHGVAMIRGAWSSAR